MQSENQGKRAESLFHLMSVAKSIAQPREILTFSPPERFEIFFQLFLGGMTLKMIPSEKGSMLSTNSSSALPPRVIIYMGEKVRVRSVVICA